MKGRVPGCIAAALIFLGATPAAADHALLIGTGSYPGLTPDLRLAAPAEDARRIRDALIRAGFAAGDITLMTDTDGIAPTRAVVLDALSALAAGAEPGEQVMVYFSGHGAQAPALDPGLESDGLDELYLMQDAAKWDGGAGRVPGAIGDQELAQAIDKIRARGADVWFVADTCHAGGLMRGEVLPPDARRKSVTPAALGITATNRTGRRAKPVAVIAPSGAFAGFYAAAPGGLALERRLPLGAPDARPLSQFSFALVRALDAGRLRSLRDLAVALNGVDATLGGGAPQPVFQGALGLSVLHLPSDRARRMFVQRGRDGLSLTAGTEEGIRPGTRFRLVEASGSKPVGTATAVTVRLGETHLSSDGKPPSGALEVEAIEPLKPAAVSLIEAAAARAGKGVARNLVVEAQLWRPGAVLNCPALDLSGTPQTATRAIDLLDAPEFGQCDVVLATIINIGDTVLDLSPFYVDAAGRLVGLAFLNEDSVRLSPGDRRRVAVRLLSEDRVGRPLPVGAEMLMLVALPASGIRPADLRGAAEHAWRGSDAASFADDAGALIYRWTVVGRSAAQRPSPAITNGAQ